MHHVALDRAGADDRHLNDQIIEAARAHAGQEVHLRAAFHLEHPKRIRVAQHVVDRRVFGRQVRQIVTRAVVHSDQIERLADAGEHSQRQDVDLEDAQRFDIVLIPGDHGAVGHGGVFDGHQFIEAALGHDEPAHMLRQVAGEALDLEDQLHRLGQARIGRVEARGEAGINRRFDIGRAKIPPRGTQTGRTAAAALQRHEVPAEPRQHQRHDR